MLPALNKARQQARPVECLSNSHLIYTGLVMYGVDNHNSLPMAWHIDGAAMGGVECADLPAQLHGQVHQPHQQGVAPSRLAGTNRSATLESYIRFEQRIDASKVKVLSCMTPQQDPTLGRVGPHRSGKAWNILWRDGSTTVTTGFFGSPATFNNYVNFSGTWK